MPLSMGVKRIHLGSSATGASYHSTSLRCGGSNRTPAQAKTSANPDEKVRRPARVARIWVPRYGGRSKPAFGQGWYRAGLWPLFLCSEVLCCELTAQDNSTTTNCFNCALPRNICEYPPFTDEAISAIAKLMGHATIQMSMRYAHLSPDFNQAAVDKLMDFGIKGTPKRTPAKC
jgi:hypothetical protein